MTKKVTLSFYIRLDKFIKEFWIVDDERIGGYGQGEVRQSARHNKLLRSVRRSIARKIGG